jgi:hypothetical protein
MDQDTMLKITVQESEGAETIKLDGKIAGPWVEELSRTWHALAPSLGRKRLELDMRGVGYVDDKGRKLLREIYQRTNAYFLADSPLIRYFADEAMRQSSNDGEEVV